MLSLPPSTRIFLHAAPTDMRKSFDTLAALVRGALGCDPLSGHLFVFVSRRRDRIKVLYWDRDGYALWSKRLERGTFRLPAARAGRIELKTSELLLLLEGFDPGALPKSRRYTAPGAVAL